MPNKKRTNDVGKQRWYNGGDVMKKVARSRRAARRKPAGDAPTGGLTPRRSPCLRGSFCPEYALHGDPSRSLVRGDVPAAAALPGGPPLRGQPARARRQVGPPLQLGVALRGIKRDGAGQPSACYPVS